MQEKNLPFQPVVENWWRPSQQLLSLTRTGELPILIDQGQVLGNDYVACEYLDEAYPQHGANLMGLTLSQRAETRLIMSWFDRMFYQDVYWTIFYERALKRHLKKGAPDTAIVKSGLQALTAGMEIIEGWTQRHTYLNAHSLSWADIAGVAHLSCLDYLGDVPWGDFPGVKEWYMKIKCRPTFRPLLEWSFPGITPSPWYRSLDF